jgi:ankyrin repeat protein
MVVALLASGADPNIPDFSKKTPIFYSIEINDFESIYALTDKGATLTCVDDYNKSPVDYAYEKRHLQLISYLFRKQGSLADHTKRTKINKIIFIYEISSNR